MSWVTQSDFRLGQIHPALYGKNERGGIVNSGCQTLTNWLVTQWRTAKSRGGFRRVASVRDASEAAALIPFVDGGSSYVVEANDSYLRFYNYSSNVPAQITTTAEIASPYTASQVNNVQFVMSEDGLYLAEENHALRQLTRASDTSWTLSTVSFGANFPPLKRRQQTIAISLNDNTANTNRVLTSTEPLFTDTSTDQWKVFQMHGGFVRVGGFYSSTSVAVHIFLSNPQAASATTDWTLYVEEGSETGANITVDLLGGGGTAGESVELTASSGIFTESHVGYVMDIDSSGTARTRYVQITEYTAADTVTATVIDNTVTAVTYTDSRFLAPQGTSNDATISSNQTAVGTGATLTASASTFTSAMARTAAEPGAYIRLFGGYAEITAVGGGTSATAEIFRALSSTGATDKWEMSPSLDSGFPRAVALHQGRLMLAGCKPGWFAGSKTNELDDFLPGDQADDAIQFQAHAASEKATGLVSTEDLLLFAADAEIKVGGTPLSAEEFGADVQSYFGSSLVQPVFVGGMTVFASRDGQRLMASTFDSVSERYLAFDLSKGTDLLEGETIKRIGYAHTLEPGIAAIIVLTNSGELLALTWDRQDEIRGWSKITPAIGDDETTCTVDSFCVVPNGSRDDIWIVAKRTINSATTRYVEVYDPDARTDSYITEDDLTITASSISGLSGYEGLEVAALLDGANRGNFTVSSGAIDLSELNLAEAPTDVEIGLPYTYTMVLRPPIYDDQTGEGWMRGSQIKEVRVRVKDTLGLDIDGFEGRGYRETQDAIDSAPSGYTGLLISSGVSAIQDEDDPTTTLSGTSPHAAHVLQVGWDLEME